MRPQALIAGLIALAAFESSAVAANGRFDIAFIGSQYSDMALFHQDAAVFMNSLMQIEPFKTRAVQFYGYLIDNEEDLGCGRPIPDFERILLCNDSQVIQRVNNAGVPHDLVVVIVNTPFYGGSGGEIAVVYSGRYGPAIFAHEGGGHIIGHLADEYVYLGEGEIDNRVHGIGEPGEGNCYAGVPPAAPWEGLVLPSDYRLGCTYSNWYAPSQSSLMSDYDATSFNLVSQGVINRRLDLIAGPLTPSMSRCDVNNDGATNVTDVQAAVNQALGSLVCRNDINQDGFCNVVDVQRIVNAALSSECISE